MMGAPVLRRLLVCFKRADPLQCGQMTILDRLAWKRSLLRVLSKRQSTGRPLERLTFEYTLKAVNNVLDLLFRRLSENI